MDNEASFLKDPTVVFMTSLLADVRRGAIQLPRFQRRSVWSVEQRLNLLDSVYRGIPIGAIMLWRTSARVASRERIGPHVVQSGSEAGPHQYILDGGQRIATLLGALYAEPPASPGVVEGPVDPDDTFEFYYDLKEQCFVTRGPEELAPDHWLPLPEALQTVTLLRFQRKLQGPDADEWVMRADTVATRFRAYKVPIILLGSDDIELATTTFKRVNSTGTPMSDMDMVAALTWSPTFDLELLLAEQRELVLVEAGWESLEDETWLRCIKATLGLDLYARADEVRIALQKDAAAVHRSAESLGSVSAFLRETCHVERPALVPYAHQIPLLVQLFSVHPKPTPEMQTKIAAWFWLTTYAGLFAGISGYGLSRAQSDLERLAREGILLWPGRRPFKREPLPRRFDFRHARARALSVQLASRHKEGPLDLARFGADAMVQLVTRGPGKESPGNRFFFPGGGRGARIELAEMLPSSSERLHHLVSDAAWQAYQDKDMETFVRLRTVDLNAMEEELVSHWAIELDAAR